MGPTMDNFRELTQAARSCALFAEDYELLLDRDARHCCHASSQFAQAVCPRLQQRQCSSSRAVSQQEKPDACHVAHD